MGLLAAIYTRISKDDTGAGTATARQAVDCERLAELRDWTVAARFEDVDLSAYSGVVRPGFVELQAGIEAHAFDIVLVWKLDRLVRRPREFEQFWALCERNQIALASVTEPIDTSTDLGLAIVRILVTFAGLETATMGVRQSAKSRDNAYRGKAPGGGAPFGYTARYEGIVESEAAVIREAARRVILGESLEAICRDLGQRGVVGRRGKPIQGSSLRLILASPRLTGDRVYRGEVVARDCLPAILDRATAAAVGETIAVRVGTHSGVEYYLLSGLLRCGRCGGPMNGRTRERLTRTYQCRVPSDGGCGRVSVHSGRLDRLVIDQYIARVPQTPLRRTVARPRSTTELEHLLDEHLRSLTALSFLRHEEAQLTALEYAEGVQRLTCALQQQAAAPATHRRDVLGSTRREVGSLWEHLDLRERKAMLRSEINYVVIDPIGSRTGAKLDDSRVTIVWWGDPDPLYGPRPTAPSAIDERWLRHELDQARSYASIGRELDLPTEVVRRFAIDHDMRSKGTGPAALPIDPTWLREQIGAGRSLTALAIEAGCSRGAIRNHAQRHGIPIPPPGHPLATLNALQ